MQFLNQANFDFMRYRGLFVVLSILLLLVGGVSLLPRVLGINWGIDFAGGTQLTVSFKEPVEDEDVRDILAGAGIDAQIQRYGDETSLDKLIKAPVVEGSQEGSGDTITAALDQALNGDQGDKIDLNQRGVQIITDLLVKVDPEALASGGDPAAARQRYEELAAAIVAARQQGDSIFFHDLAEIDAVTALPPGVANAVKNNAFLGAFQVIQNDNVGPQIGGELQQKGAWAVGLSLLGMLAYIWYRFELRFGIGALVAVFHDFLIVLGLFALIQYEFNLPTIAAFLTLVGYSVNDTVVIFDRVRENMRRHRRKPLIDVMNESINQTLSRTVMTSGTTLLVVGCLFVLGGEPVRGFAFVLLVGVVVGTYSSIFVASPFALLWEQYFGRDTKDKTRGAESARTT